jgi:hypothetical protein
VSALAAAAMTRQAAFSAASLSMPSRSSMWRVAI